MGTASGNGGTHTIAPGLAKLRRPVADLSSDPSNARRHGERDLEAIKASLRRFGQQKPIVVDADGVCIAGSGTLDAARALGWTHIAAVTSPLRGADRAGYAIADNRTAELSEWEPDALRAIMASIDDAEILAATGFADGELDDSLPAVDVPLEGVDLVESHAGDVWRIRKVSPQSMVHLTEKPVALARKAIDLSSRRGDVVLDLFGGSGSTLMAAEMSDRRAVLTELDPAYCDVIVERWEQATGGKATRKRG